MLTTSVFTARCYAKHRIAAELESRLSVRLSERWWLWACVLGK